MKIPDYLEAMLKRIRIRVRKQRECMVGPCKKDDN